MQACGRTIGFDGTVRVCESRGKDHEIFEHPRGCMCEYCRSVDIPRLEADLKKFLADHPEMNL